jgi:hypothetical protein
MDRTPLYYRTPRRTDGGTASRPHPIANPFLRETTLDRERQTTPIVHTPLHRENREAEKVTPYSDCEGNTIYITIDVQDNDSGYTTPAFTGKNTDDSRALIILATCATQFAHTTRNKDPNPDRLDRLSHALNFAELRKPSA